jgi:hypothetical protein
VFPLSRRPWYVLDVDDGVLRREPTRRKAVAWLLVFSASARVRRRYRYGSGSYEYTVGNSIIDAQSWFIAREDCMTDAGWDPHQVPRFPLVDDSWRDVERATDTPAAAEDGIGSTHD